jgi:renierapurpurin 18,18'-hydroxylase
MISEVTQTTAGGVAADLRKVKAHPDHWYPVAWSRELRGGKTIATSFAGEPIVLARPKNSSIFALEDRCAHRQVPLSQGVLDGENLRCCYHGWSYDACGRCVDVPYLGKGKLPNGVRSYPVCECDGMIFVWPGASPARTPPQSLGAANDSAYRTRRFGKVVACHYTFMHENLMDMNHQFLHRRTTGKVVPRYLTRRKGTDWIEVDYTFSRPDKNAPMGEKVILGRFQKSDKRDTMTVRTEYPYQTLRIWTSTNEPMLSVWLAYTPVDRAQRLNRTFILLSVRRFAVPGLLDICWPILAWFTNRVFAEDCAIVEMEQSAYDAQGADWNREVFPPIHDLRGLLANNGWRTAVRTGDVGALSET